MIRKIFLSKGLYFPYISLILIISCLVVSIPSHYSAPLYAHLVPWNSIYQNYQLFTSQFVHGNMIGFGGMSFELHLFTNLITIVFFGVFCERILGSSKILILSVISVFANIFTRLMINSFGTGISGVSWSYIPLAVYIYFKTYKYEKRKFFSSAVNILMLILFALAWFGVTLGNFIMRWNTSNLFHLVATFAGFVFLIIWKKDIDCIFNHMIVNEKGIATSYKLTILDKFSVLVSLVVLAALSKIIITFFSI